MRIHQPLNCTSCRRSCSSPAATTCKLHPCPGCCCSCCSKCIKIAVYAAHFNSWEQGCTCSRNLIAGGQTLQAGPTRLLLLLLLHGGSELVNFTPGSSPMLLCLRQQIAALLHPQLQALQLMLCDLKRHAGHIVPRLLVLEHLLRTPQRPVRRGPIYMPTTPYFFSWPLCVL